VFTTKNDGTYHSHFAQNCLLSSLSAMIIAKLLIIQINSNINYHLG